MNFKISAETRARVHSLYEEYSSALHRYVLKRLGRKDQADDVSQETFARLLRVDPSKFDADPVRYLYGIASHIIADKIRQAVRERKVLAERNFDEPCQVDDPSEPLDLQRQVQRALKTLPPLHAAILLCIRRDRMTHEETAERVGVSVKSVPHYLHEAIERLKSLEWDL